MNHPYDVLHKLMEKFDDKEGVTYVTSALHAEIAHEINDLMSYGFIRLVTEKSMANRAAFDITAKGLEAYDMPSAYFVDMDKSVVWSKGLEPEAKSGNLYFKNVHTGALASVDPLRWDNFATKPEWVKITENEYLDLINDAANEAVERDADMEEPHGGHEVTSVWETPMHWNLPVLPVNETVKENVVANLPVPDKSWLQNALEITTSDRRRDYGHPLPNFLRICLKWSVTLEIPVTPLHVAQLMLDMKTARDQNSFKDDNWIDAIGYSNTVQMIDERMKLLDYPAGAKTFQDKNIVNMVGFMYNLLQMHELRFSQGT